MISAVRHEVKLLLKNADRMHETDHIDRVVELSRKFMNGMHQADPAVVQLIALLHSVDDHDMNGLDTDNDLPCARYALDRSDVSDLRKKKVLDGIREIGFRRRLQGIRPSTDEAGIVSDADMCDGMGLGAIVRMVQYGKATGRPFFRKDRFPRKMITYGQYMNEQPETTINSIFEEIFRMKDMMMTEPGRLEAAERCYNITKYLESFFKENDTPEWNRFLTENPGATGEPLMFMAL